MCTVIIVTQQQLKINLNKLRRNKEKSKGINVKHVYANIADFIVEYM
jgi:hypothetical protein